MYENQKGMEDIRNVKYYTNFYTAWIPLYFTRKRGNSFQKNLKVELKETLSVIDLIEDKKDYEILNAEEKIDTSKLGEQKISVKYKKRRKKETFVNFEVVDTESPKIEYASIIEITLGEQRDLLENVTAKDNSEEKILVTIEGDYDMNKEGEYSLTYVAIDSSGNKASEKFTLKVTKEVEHRNNYPKLPVPTIVKKEIGKSKKGYTIYEIDGSVYIDDILIANKTYALKDGFIPTDTYISAENVTSQCSTCINNTAYKAWLDMKADASALGLNIWIQSGYRPQSLQERLYNDYVVRDGQNLADTYSSRPGHSEHQTGLCFDLNSISDAFGNTEEGKWVNENAYLYGFIIRFPKGKEKETGYKYESWHLRYVGTNLSYKLYNNGDWLSLEDYFGITSEYQD